MNATTLRPMLTIVLNAKERYTVPASKVDTAALTWTSGKGDFVRVTPIKSFYPAAPETVYLPTDAQLARMADSACDASFDEKTGELSFSAR